MDTAQDNKSSKDRRHESAGPPPLKQFTQRVLPGFERVGVVPYVLEKSSKPTKARRQRRAKQVTQERIIPHPDQLSLPLRAI